MTKLKSLSPADSLSCFKTVLSASSSPRNKLICRPVGWATRVLRGIETTLALLTRPQSSTSVFHFFPGELLAYKPAALGRCSGVFETGGNRWARGPTGFSYCRGDPMSEGVFLVGRTGSHWVERRHAGVITLLCVVAGRAAPAGLLWGTPITTEYVTLNNAFIFFRTMC